jgi:hypothetical protein
LTWIRVDPEVDRVRTIPGFGKTSAAELAGEIGTLGRFTSEASLALYLGMAALDNQSGQYHGMRRPREVNGRAKAAMTTAVARHIECVPQSKAYYDKKRAEGKRHNQAVRALGPLGSNMLPDREGSLRLSGMRVDCMEELWSLTGEGGDVGLTLAPLRLLLARRLEGRLQVLVHEVGGDVRCGEPGVTQRFHRPPDVLCLAVEGGGEEVAQCLRVVSLVVPIGPRTASASVQDELRPRDGPQLRKDDGGNPRWLRGAWSRLSFVGCAMVPATFVPMLTLCPFTPAGGSSIL